MGSVSLCKLEDEEIIYTTNGAFVLTNNMFGIFIENECSHSILATKEDAQNLIKALEKAIELGWWK